MITGVDLTPHVAFPCSVRPQQRHHRGGRGLAGVEDGARRAGGIARVVNTASAVSLTLSVVFGVRASGTEDWEWERGGEDVAAREMCA